MVELVLTGWMSNRGRQIVASYLVNDLGQSWLAGALFFEHHLIDYDPCSNYGNWAYLGGVGNDPRPVVPDRSVRFHRDRDRLLRDGSIDGGKLWTGV